MGHSRAARFKLIIESLGEVALKDQQISDDEFNILKQVSFDLIQYDKAMKKAMEDGIITTQEQLQLNNLKAQIEKNVITVANEDHKISDDEAQIIKKLSEVLRLYF
ncbi:MAG: hypothetical protein ACW99A_08705 [Candidatus Kariarchaeaceae archaeon]|jgi:hypothetical protein